MKNIHILPTTQPSRLAFDTDENFYLLCEEPVFFEHQELVENRSIYITSSEEIKEGVNQWYLDKFLNKPMNSGGAQYGEKQNIIILTTDPTLIADGVQSIDDEFLEWFVKNPTCEFVEVNKKLVEFPLTFKMMYKIIIPQEEPKQEFLLFDKERANTITSEGQKTVRELQNTIQQETLEEAAENYSKGWGENDDEKSFISGGKWMEKRMFSKEEVRQIAEWSFHFYKTNEFDDSELEEEWYKLLDERLNKK